MSEEEEDQEEEEEEEEEEDEEEEQDQEEEEENYQKNQNNLEEKKTDQVNLNEFAKYDQYSNYRKNQHNSNNQLYQLPQQQIPFQHFHNSHFQCQLQQQSNFKNITYQQPLYHPLQFQPNYYETLSNQYGKDPMNNIVQQVEKLSLFACNIPKGPQYPINAAISSSHQKFEQLNLQRNTMFNNNHAGQQKIKIQQDENHKFEGTGNLGDYESFLEFQKFKLMRSKERVKEKEADYQITKQENNKGEPSLQRDSQSQSQSKKVKAQQEQYQQDEYVPNVQEYKQRANSIRNDNSQSKQDNRNPLFNEKQRTVADLYKRKQVHQNQDQKEQIDNAIRILLKE